jgi:hypothetical protein
LFAPADALPAAIPTADAEKSREIGLLGKVEYQSFP